MKIKNNQMEDLANFLLDMKLKGFENRMRNKFLKMLTEHMKSIQEEHKELLKDYCDMDENGEFITFVENGKSFYSIPDTIGFQNEFNQLMNEFLYIEVNDGNKDMLLTLKNIVLSCDKEFSGQEALQYENFCEIFENELLISN